MSQSPQFEIGQIIYVLSNKTQSILPCIVQEQIHHRRLDGDSVSYKIVFGPPGKQKVVDLTRVDGETYGTLEEVREVVIADFTKLVDNLINEASQRTETWYGEQGQSNVVAPTGEKVDPQALLNEMTKPQPMPMQQTGPVMTIPMQPQQTNYNGSLRNQMTDPDLMQRDLVMEDGSVKKVSINLNPKQG